MGSVSKSNHNNFIYITQNHNYIGSAGFTICAMIGILCPKSICCKSFDLNFKKHLNSKHDVNNERCDIIRSIYCVAVVTA